MSDTLSTLDLLYFDGLENEEGDYRPIFIPNACHVCKAMHNSTDAAAVAEKTAETDKQNEVKVVKRLLSCSGCKLIAYCGSVHQKQHWSEHKVSFFSNFRIFLKNSFISLICNLKEFCKAVQKILRQEGRKSIFYAATEKRNQPVSAESWKSIRYNWMVRLEHSLSVCEFQSLILYSCIFVWFHQGVVTTSIQTRFNSITATDVTVRARNAALPSSLLYLLHGRRVLSEPVSIVPIGFLLLR